MSKKFEYIPQFEYTPTCTSVECIATRLASGSEFPIEHEIHEFVHLHYVLGIPTVELSQAINELTHDADIKDELKYAFVIVSCANAIEEALKRNDPDPFAITNKTAHIREEDFKKHVSDVIKLKQRYNV